MKLQKPLLFSVIIPIRQENDYLKETLSYLKKQTLKNFEVLVITDKISITPNPSQKRNIGAKRAKGKYLVFFDDDSYPSLNYFKNATKLVKKHQDFAAFCGPCLTPKNDNLYQQASGLVWSSPLGSGGAGVYRNSIKKPRFVNDYPSVNLIVKKGDFISAGSFNKKYWPGEDTLLCLGLTQKLNKKIYYHPSLIVYHHRRSVIIPHLQQITRYGIQRGYFAKIFPKTSLKIGYFIPTIFDLYLIFLLINSLFLRYEIAYLPLYLYLSILLINLIHYLFSKKHPLSSLLATLTIPLTHIYYGILFLYGLFQKEAKFKPHSVDKKTGKYLGG